MFASLFIVFSCIGVSVVSGAKRTASESLNDMFQQVPEDILKQIPFECGNVSKATMQSEHMIKSPLNPVTFFMIITKGSCGVNRGPINLLFSRWHDMTDSEVEVLFEYLASVQHLPYFDFGLDTAISIYKHSKVQPFGYEAQRYKISRSARHALLSLVFGSGSFQYISPERRQHFMLLSRLYHPEEYKVYAKLAEEYNSGLIDINGLLESTNMDKEWLIEHLLSLDDRAMLRHVLTNQSSVDICKSMITDALEKKSIIISRLVKIIHAALDDELLTNTVDQLLGPTGKGAEGFEVVLVGTSSGSCTLVRRSLLCILFVR